MWRGRGPAHNITVDVQYGDTAQHQIAVYLLDWDSNARTETVTVMDGNTNTVLDTRMPASFHNGTYLVWNVSGHVKLQFTNTNSGSNVVVSGLFFDPVGGSPQTVVAPMFNPGAGAVAAGQQVTISTATAGASIRYTTDGSTPSETAGTLYSTPVTVNSAETIQAIAYEAGMTDSSVSSAGYTISASTGSASFVRTDTTTQGSWKGEYGTSGYNVITDTVGYPSNVTVTPSGQQSYQWAPSTTDVRALQMGSGTGRVAGTWYSATQFTVDVQYGDTAQHQIAVYLLDWDSNARTETVTVMDGNTNTVLDTRMPASFHNGTYLVWNVSGHVKLQFTNTNSGSNVVVSGLFFDPVGGSPQTVVAPMFNPGAGAVAAGQQVTISTATAGASIRYTTDGSTPSETAGTLYSTPVTVNSAETIQAIAYEAGMTDSSVSSAGYTISASTGSASFVRTDTTTQGSWKGEYGTSGYNVITDTVGYPSNVTVTPSGQQSYQWAPSTTDVRALQMGSGTGRVAGTWYSATQFTVDVQYGDTAQHQIAVYLLDWDSNARTETVTVMDGNTNTVLDTRMPASFHNGTYLVWNVSGHVKLQFTNTNSGSNVVVSGLFFDPVGGSPQTVVAPMFNPGAGAVAAGQQVTISTATAGASIRYTTDGSTPSETAGTLYSTPVTVNSAETIQAIAYEAGMTDSSVSSAGYTISANGNSASFVKFDTTTQGNWQGSYGADGFNIVNDTVQYPGYATVTPSGQSSWTWAGSSGDVRALQKKSVANDRIAATWYSGSTIGNSFSIDVNLTDGNSHQIAIYCLDWDAQGRSERIDILDPNGVLLDSRNVSSFSALPEYLVWNVQGHVTIKVTLTGGVNAVISGLFFR